ncbi:uncharacterized protein LOC126799827 [Argentina anserina]|uniref:uncharacterized protein LOC126799827 n=1 Tax=Argentina anserina TaxID=57926 RepID=UPI0021762CBE|nr:uncharacterized protein LOC126799827 [Potentilla anserina]
MNYLNRVFMAASVPTAPAPSDQVHRWNSGLNSFHISRRRDTSSDLRPPSGGTGTGLSGGGGVAGKSEERRQQSDESLQRVMYLNCWGQG